MTEVININTETGERELLSRQKRRLANKQGTPLGAYNKLMDAQKRLDALAARKSAGIEKTKADGNFSQLMYAKDPDPYLAYLSASQRFHEAIDEYQQITGSSNLPDGIVYADLMNQRYHGVNLLDIAGLEYPLTADGIALINRHIRQNALHVFERPSPLQIQVIVQSFMIPAQSFARSDFPTRSNDRHSPKNIQPLADRFTNYLDFYTPFIVNPSSDEYNQTSALLNITWVGPRLIRMLGSYIPAKVGISPSSALKSCLFALEGNPDFAKKRFLNTFQVEAQHAFRPDALPQQLHPYMVYSPEVDQEANLRLQSAYQTRMAEYPTDLDQVAQAYSQKRADFKRAIAAEKNQLKFKADIGSQTVSVTATAQYSKAVAFILNFRDGPVHLTLDLTDADQLFGMPSQTLAEHPIIASHLKRDITQAAAALAVERYPAKIRLEDLPPAEKWLAPHPGRSLTERVHIALSNTTDEKIDPEKKPRFQQIRSWISTFNLTQPPLPDTERAEVLEFPVNHSPELVREKVGPKVPERKVRQIIKDIRTFERGGKRRRRLVRSRNVTEDGLLRIQSGDFRVVLKANGSTFDIHEIEDRKDIAYY